MKLKITQKLKDKKTNEFFEVGTIIDRSDKRGKELIDAGAAEKVSEKEEVVVEEVVAEAPKEEKAPKPQPKKK